MSEHVSRSFSTNLGRAYLANIEDFLVSPEAKRLAGKVDLIFTSPPFPLASPKKYGNKVGEQYLNWMVDVARGLRGLLSDSGSLVVEIGNCWTKGSPTMSLLPLKTLLSIDEDAGFFTCQQFIWENTAKLPGPATYVNGERIRLKDSHTNVWWYSKVERPKANNKNVLTPYKDGHLDLLRTKKYNHGERPSEHRIGEKSFLKDNGGAIRGSNLRFDGDVALSSVIRIPNTKRDRGYYEWCREHELVMHPARMPLDLAKMFIEFLTDPEDLVLDPFGGSCTTGQAAEDLGRRWVAVERDGDYLEGAKGRFKVVRRN